MGLVALSAVFRGMMVLFALGMASAGCQSSANLGADCARATECTGGLVCRFGRCRAECSTNRDCPAGSTCFLAGDGNGACSLAVDRSCTGGMGTECATGLMCLGGQCVRTCSSPADCPSDGECRPVPGSSISFCFDVRVQAPDTGPPAADAGIDAPVISQDAGDAGFTTRAMPSAHVCSGGGFICSIEGAAGEVHCWGDAKYGTLGPGTTDCTTLVGVTDLSTASRVVQRGSGALSGADGLACGAEFACAHLVTGEVWCWGNNAQLQLGQPAATPCSSSAQRVPIPSPVPDIDARILAADREACLFEPGTGRLRCWGEDLGIVGTPGTHTPLATPTAAAGASGAGARLVWVGMGRGFACGVTEYGDPHCWGDGGRGQTMSSTPRPTWISAIGTGREHGVAIHDFDMPASWGSNLHEALLEPPDGALVDCGVPCTPLALDAPEHFSTAVTQGDASFTCAIVGADGHVECWGENRALQAGVPDPTDAGVASFGTPVLLEDGVTVLHDVVSLAVGFENACARTSSPADLYCWGANDRGQLQLDPGTSDQLERARRMAP